MSSNLKRMPVTLPIPNKPYALFLDIDGTLAPLAATPDLAQIPSKTLNLLQTLKRSLNGALALISGRSLSDIDNLSQDSEFVAAGQHGLEIRYNNQANGLIVNSENLEIIKDIQDQVKNFHLDYPSLLIEYKSLSVAIHYRSAPELEHIVKTMMKEISKPYSKTLTLQEGKMVFEIRLKGADKGLAIRQIMQLPPFTGRLPIFAGDDITDEDGFASVNKLGGISIKIGRGKTCATHRANNIEELQDWLGVLAS